MKNSCANCAFAKNLVFDGCAVSWDCEVLPSPTKIKLQGRVNEDFKKFYCSRYKYIF